MKYYKFYLIALLLIILSVPAIASAEKYKCVSESGTGFTYNSKTKAWEVKNYKTDLKYTINPVERTPPENRGPNDIIFTVTKFYEAVPYCTCKEYFNKYGDIFCDCIAGEFTFNRKTGVFLYGYMAGYYTTRYTAMTKEPPSPRITLEPYMSIGTCSLY